MNKQQNSAKQLIFTLFNVINKYRVISLPIAFFYLSVNFLQLFYLLNAASSYRDKSDHDFFSVFDFFDVFSKVTMVVPILEQNLGIFKLFFSITYGISLFLMLIFLWALLFVTFKIYSGQNVSFSLPVTFLKMTFTTFQFTLYMPALFIFNYPFFGNYHDEIPEILKSPFFKTVNIIMTTLVIILHLLFTFFNNDSIFAYDNALCRNDTKQEKLKFLIDTSVSLMLIIPFEYKAKAFLKVVFSVVFFFNLLQNFKYTRYKNNTVEVLVNALNVTTVQQLIRTSLIELFDYEVRDYSVSVFICLFVAFFIFSMIQKKKSKVVLEKSFWEIETLEEALLYTDELQREIEACLLENDLSSVKVSSILLEFGEACKDKGCFLEEESVFLPRTNKSYSISTGAHKNEAVLVHLLKEIYKILLQKFGNSSEFIFQYSCFMLFTLCNINLALIEIEKGIKKADFIQLEFSYFKLKQVANERLLQSEHNFTYSSEESISLVNILDVIVFDQLSSELIEKMNSCAKSKAKFWNYLSESFILVEELFELGEHFLNEKHAVNRIWEDIGAFSSGNKKINELMRSFFQMVCDDYSNLTVKVDEGTDDVVEARFYDSTGYVVVSTNLNSDIGLIKKSNDQFSKLLGYGKDELISKNIYNVVPKYVSKFHNSIIKEYIITGKNEIIGNKTLMFFRTKGMYIKPMFNLVCPMPNLHSNSEVIALVKDKFTKSHYILCNEYGNVCEFSKEINNKCFTLDPKLISSGLIDVLIFFFIPKLLKPSVMTLNNKTVEVPLICNKEKIGFLGETEVFMDELLIPILLEEVTENKEQRRGFLLNSRVEQFIKVTLGSKTREIESKIEIYKKLIEYFKEVRSALKKRDFSVVSTDFKKAYGIYMNYLDELKNGAENNYIWVSRYNLTTKYIKFSFKKRIKELFVFDMEVPLNDIDKEFADSHGDLHPDSGMDRISVTPENTFTQSIRFIDDIGSVSSSNSSNTTAIFNIVQKIRDKRFRKDKTRSFLSKWLLYLMLLILMVSFSLVWYLNYDLARENEGKGKLYTTYSEMHSTIIRLEKEVIQMNKEALNQTIIKASQLNKQLTELAISTESKSMIRMIDSVKLVYEGKEYSLQSIFNKIVSNAKRIDSSPKNKAFILSIANEKLEQTLHAVLEIINEQINTSEENTTQNLIWMIISIGILTLLLVGATFQVMRSNHHQNKKVLDLFKHISKTEITEIVSQVEEFQDLLNEKVLNTLEKDKSDLGTAVFSMFAGEDSTKILNRRKLMVVSFIYNILYIVIVVVLLIITEFYVIKTGLAEYKQHFDFLKFIYHSKAHSKMVAEGIVALSKGETQENVTREDYNDSLEANNEMFNYFNREVNSAKLNGIFFDSVCETGIQFNCQGNVLDKGLKFTLVNFLNKVNLLIEDILAPNYVPNTTQIREIEEMEELWIGPTMTFVEEENLREMRSISLFYFILEVSLGSLYLVLLFILIVVRWSQYTSQVSREEYLSNKLLVEIPMNLITKNSFITNHLFSFNKHSLK